MTAPVPPRPSRSTARRFPATAHRVRLFLSLLGLPFETRRGRPGGRRAQAPGLPAPQRLRPGAGDRGRRGRPWATRTRSWSTSNERYAADPARWYPRDPLAAAQVQRWLSVAAGQLAAGPAVARVIVLFGLARDPAEVIARSHDLLRVMEARTGAAAVPRRRRPDPGRHRATTPTWRMRRKATCRSKPTRSVRGWLARIEALPGFVPMGAPDARAARHERRGRSRRRGPSTTASARCRPAPACASAWRSSARA